MVIPSREGSDRFWCRLSDGRIWVRDTRQPLWVASRGAGQGSFSEVGRLAPDDSFKSANLSPCSPKFGTSHGEEGVQRRLAAILAADVAPTRLHGQRRYRAGKCRCVTLIMGSLPVSTYQQYTTA